MPKAYQLLKSRKNWTQFKPAVNADGHAVEPCEKDAIAWCTLGALIKCYPCFRERQIIKSRLRGIVGNIPLWNDSGKTTHKDVVKALREAERGEEE